MRARVLAVLLALVAGVLTAGVAQAGVPGQPSVVATGFTVPWAMSWLPNGQSMLVTQRNDFHVWLVNRSGQRTDVGVVPESQTTGAEGGLMGVAVSPTWNGTSDQSVYFMHTSSEGNRVARMSFNGSSLSGYTVLVRGIQKNTFHNGGRLAFGPDGFLYAATGDAQNTGNAQNRSSLNGKILRFTTAGQPAPGNPFGNLVYSLGHRNPQGLAWDSAGRLWASELGQNTWDELNLIESGRNYGWPVCEGTCNNAAFVNPKATWPTAQASPSGIAIVGSTVFMAALRGTRLWRIELNGTSAGTITSHFQGQFGRLRAVVRVPGANAIWFATSNADQSGGQPVGSDRILTSTITG